MKEQEREMRYDDSELQKQKGVIHWVAKSKSREENKNKTIYDDEGLLFSFFRSLSLQPSYVYIQASDIHISLSV